MSVGLWDINNAYFKYSIWGSSIARNYTKMEVFGTPRVKYNTLHKTPYLDNITHKITAIIKSINKPKNIFF